MRSVLSAIIVLLALAVGVLHLALDAVLFHWHLSPFGTFRGHAAFMPLPILFLLNFVGYVVLVALFLLAARASDVYVRIVDVLLLLMTVGTLVGWNYFHRPNPHGLGHIAVTLEVVLFLALLVHVAAFQRSRAISLAT